MSPCPLISTLFPYTTLFRSLLGGRQGHAGEDRHRQGPHDQVLRLLRDLLHRRAELRRLDFRARRREDRKSTRLNSSHLGISYAVFCLKKKKRCLSTIDVNDV